MARSLPRLKIGPVDACYSLLDDGGVHCILGPIRGAQQVISELERIAPCLWSSILRSLLRLLRLLRFLRLFRVRRRLRSVEHCGFESRYGFDLLLKIAH